jgi:radical SAM protein with 4Fe4S-binding SPASM domain
VEDLSPTPEQLEEALNKIWDLSVKYEGKFDIHVHCPHFARVVKQRNIPNFDEWYENKFHGKCTYFAFGGYISIIENGNLIPCFYTDLRPMEPMNIGNIRDHRSLMEVWEEMKVSPYYSSFRNRTILKGKCGVCEYREICGGCRNRAYALTGDIYGQDDACVYIPQEMRKNSNQPQE